MDRLFLPFLLVILGVIGLVEHEPIGRQWAAMYPNDPARQAALERCYLENHQFNRLSAAMRAACYDKYLQVELLTEAAGVAGRRT